MKKFIKWKILIISCLVCLAPILLGLALWDKLPDTIAIHFDINNNPDNFASKGFTVFGLPLMMVALQCICCIINDVNAKKFGERKKFELATKWIIPCMSVTVQTITFMYALDMKVDIRICTMIICGIIFLVIGNYLPKFEYIRNFKGELQKARKINRTLGYASVVMGILALISVFLPPIASLVWIFLLIPYAIFSTVYAVIVIKNGTSS